MNKINKNIMDLTMHMHCMCIKVVAVFNLIKYVSMAMNVERTANDGNTANREKKSNCMRLAVLSMF